MSREQNAVQNHSVMMGNKTSESEAKFKYLVMTLTNYVNEEIKSRLNSANVCYHTVQNLLSSFCYVETKTTVCRATILAIVLYECEDRSLTVMKEYRLRVFEYRVLRKVF